MLDETQNIPPVPPKLNFKLSSFEKFFMAFTGHKASDVERNTVNPEEVRKLVLFNSSDSF